MKVSMCKVYDGDFGEWIDIGVFSTHAKAMNGGYTYIMNACHEANVIDWEDDTNVYTTWFQSPKGHIFTRVVTECEVDRALA